MPSRQLANGVGFDRKLVSAAIAIATVAALMVFVLVIAPRARAQSAQTTSAPSHSFEAASIKINKSGSGRHSLSPNLPGGRLRAVNVSLAGLMTEAYQAPATRIFGAPAWFDSEYFDIDATSEADNSGDENHVRLQTLLADRFKLVIHHETRQLPIYALVLAKPGKLGPQFHMDDEKCGDDSPPADSPGVPPLPRTTPSSLKCSDLSVGVYPDRAHYSGRNISMERFLETLAGSASRPNVDRPIVDRTGLSGNIDFTLEFAPPSAMVTDAPNPSALPSIFTALEEQLAMKLKTETGPVDVIVIDRVEEPSEN